MKGLVFTELLSMIEEKFGEEFTEDLIMSLPLKSGAAYTAVGNYDYLELISIVKKLSEESKIPFTDLVKIFGTHLLGTFFRLYPQYFENKTAVDFLSSVDDYIHVEVLKLFPTAKLPKLDFEKVEENKYKMTYSSDKPFADLAHGLIEQTFVHFNESFNIQVQDSSSMTNRTFILEKNSPWKILKN